MPYSKEQLESFIKADEAALRNYNERMLELRRKAREEINELARLEATQTARDAADEDGASEETTERSQD